MAREWDLPNPGEIIFGLRDMLGDGLMVLRVSMVSMELAKEMLREESCSSFAMELCVTNTWLKRKSREKQHTA